MPKRSIEDRYFTQPHDTKACSRERPVFAEISFGALGMPVIAISFDNQIVANEEVHDPATDGLLCDERYADAFKFLAHDALDICLSTRCSVTPKRAIAAREAVAAGTNDAKSQTARFAGDD